MSDEKERQEKGKIVHESENIDPVMAAWNIDLGVTGIVTGSLLQ